ncbi:hypothetical protein AcV5_000505 [Taiwanofungus camphoratus]|nr:hypothetical protein AcV5_000505 [Antrodia cinnamomea]
MGDGDGGADASWPSRDRPRARSEDPSGEHGAMPTTTHAHGTPVSRGTAVGRDTHLISRRTDVSGVERGTGGYNHTLACPTRWIFGYLGYLDAGQVPSGMAVAQAHCIRVDPAAVPMNWQAMNWKGMRAAGACPDVRTLALGRRIREKDRIRSCHWIEG